MNVVRAVVEFVAAVVEVLLLLRLLFILFNLSVVGFVATIFTWTNPLLAPIVGVFPSSGALLLVLVGMIVYALIFGIIVSIFRFI